MVFYEYHKGLGIDIPKQKELSNEKRGERMRTNKITVNLEPELNAKLRDYVYTERIAISELVNRLLKEFLADKKDLLHKPEKAAV